MHYICHVNNTQGFVQKSFTVIPYFPPVFDRPGTEENLVVTEGEKVNLECFLQAKPEAEVRWKMVRKVEKF